MYFIEPTTGFLLIDTLLANEPGAWRSALHHLILPAIVLATFPLAVITRMTRSAMLEVLNDDYVRTARAKGLAAWRVIFVHALRNALIPVITIIGLLIGGLLSGAFIIEAVFAYPGIGLLAVNALQTRDFPMIQGIVLFVAVVYVGVNLLTDLLYGWLDPRIRYQ